MRIRTLFSIVPFLLTAITSCSSSQTIRIGFLGPLSGLDSQVGVQGRNGCEFAVYDINRSGGIDGKPVEIIVEDTGGNPDQALDAVIRLHRKGVCAVIAQSTSTPLAKVFPYINSNRLLLITPTASSDLYSNLNDYFFRIVLNIDTEAKALADLAYDRLKLKKVAVIYDRLNPQYTESLIAAFSNYFTSMGGRLTMTEGYTSGSNRMIGDIAKKISEKRKHVDGVMLAANCMDDAMFCQLFAGEGLAMPLLACRWALNENLIYNGGRSVNRLYLTGEFDSESTNSNFRRFKGIYADRYHSAPEIPSYASYETALILAEAVRKCVFVTSDSIRDVLLEQRVFEGLQGPVEFNQTGEADRKAYLLRVDGGKFRRINP